MLAVGTKTEATFRNASTGHDVTLELRGDFWGGSADIAFAGGGGSGGGGGGGGRVVAQITRELWNARQIFGDKQTVSRCSVAESGRKDGAGSGVCGACAGRKRSRPAGLAGTRMVDMGMTTGGMEDAR